jgi:hypothetical protein
MTTATPEATFDEDTRAVIDALDAAQARSGLDKAGFARALGTSASRYSTYRTGKVAPTAAFVIRAGRIAESLALASRGGVPSSIVAAHAIREALAVKGDEIWAFALILEARDRLLDVIANRPVMLAAWEAGASIGDRRWDTLFGTVIAHTFESCGLVAPKWTRSQPLDESWSPVGSLRYTPEQVRDRTPDWLAAVNVFVADHDLATA